MPSLNYLSLMFSIDDDTVSPTYLNNSTFFMFINLYFQSYQCKASVQCSVYVFIKRDILVVIRRLL